MTRRRRDGQPQPLLAACNELLALLTGMQAQIAVIKTQLEQEVPALPARIPVLVADDPTLDVELRDRITAVGVLCARAYGYGSRSGRPARGGIPQVAAMLRAQVGIQRLRDLRIDQLSEAFTALRRIEQDARQRIPDMSTDARDPATLIEGAVRADVARMRLRDAVGRAAQVESGKSSGELEAEPTSPKTEASR